VLWYLADYELLLLIIEELPLLDVIELSISVLLSHFYIAYIKDVHKASS